MTWPNRPGPAAGRLELGTATRHLDSSSIDIRTLLPYGVLNIVTNLSLLFFRWPAQSRLRASLPEERLPASSSLPRLPASRPPRPVVSRSLTATSKHPPSAPCLLLCSRLLDLSVFDQARNRRSP